MHFLFWGKILSAFPEGEWDRETKKSMAKDCWRRGRIMRRKKKEREGEQRVGKGDKRAGKTRSKNVREGHNE